jgi:uncharacterized integral membrane protein (TIGR00698 family)
MQQNSKIKGILFSLIFALPAYWLGERYPLIGGPVFGILLGLIAAKFPRSKSFDPGIRFTGKKILQYSIILLGFEMNLFQVLNIGATSFSVMICTLLTAFGVAYWVGKQLGLEKHTTILIGAGTAICGGSAIAAAAPVIGAKDKDIAFSISTIFLFNILAVFIFPALGHLMGLSDLGFGMWAGTAINDTSSVVAAAYSYSPAAGSYATIVKLTRALMIIPVCLLLAFFTARQKGNTSSFQLKNIFPWFILWFVFACIIHTTGIVPEQISQDLGTLGKFSIILAMSAIGLNTDILALFRNGLRPIILGLCCWFAVAVVSLLVQHFIGLI